MPRAATRESDLLDAVLARYEAEGFDVFIHPSASVLPEFMGGYRPDAIAMRPDKKIAIEIERSETQSDDQIKNLQKLFSRQHDWELFILYVSPRSTGETIDIATPLAIKRAVDQVQELKAGGHLAASLIIGWSALEAVARSLLPIQLARPQPPTKLVEVLATEGLLTPSQAGALRKAAAIRNTVAHGQLGISPDPQLLDHLISALRMLSDLPVKRRRR